MPELDKKYPGMKDKILKAYQSGYSDDMIELNVQKKIYEAYDHDYTDDMIRQNIGVAPGFKLPLRPKWYHKTLDFFTGGHMKAPGAPVPPEVYSSEKDTPDINIPETAKMGLFEDPVTALAFGTVAGAKLAAPVGKKVLHGAREALAWATGGLSDTSKLIKPGAEKLAKTISAKRIEKTMAGAFKTAEKGLGVRPAEKIIHPTLKKAAQSGAKVMDMIARRRANIDKGVLDSEVFVKNIERNLSKTERQALPFLRQGIKDTALLKRIGKEELIPIIKDPSLKLLKETEKVGKYYDEAHSFLKKSWGKDIGFIENYVTQIWDIPKNKKSRVLNYFVKTNPFLKKRKIPSLEEGIKLGLKPKTTDITELLRIYDQYKIKTVHNFKFIDEVTKLKGEDGVSLILRKDKAPVDWVTIDHPALNRVMARGTTTIKVPKTDTFTSIQKTVNRIKTIIRTVPEEVTAEGVSPRIKSLEKVIAEALQSRGMTGGESSAYLNRIKAAYSGVNIKSSNAETRKVTEKVQSAVNHVFKEIKTKFPAKVPIFKETQVAVSPEIAREVKIIFDSPINNKWINAFETANAVLKKSKLSFSMFHHYALTESAFSAGIGRKSLKQWNPVKIIKAVRNKNYDIFKQLDLTKDAIDHKVTFGALEEYNRSRVVKILKGLEFKARNTPGLKQVTKGIRSANDLWDAALWDYLHNSYKLYGYESNVAKALKHGEKMARKQFGRSLNPKETEAIKNEIGLFINDSFGGQNWELNKVLGNPKIRQMLHWVMLAPDWTFSTLKQAAAPFRGMAKTITAKGDIPQKLAGKALTKRGTMFWAKSAAYFTLISQSVNYRNTKKEYGQGRFTWNNPKGNTLNIFIGRNEDGSERYLRLGKQFREVLQWSTHPLATGGAKASPLVQEIAKQSTGHSLGSGYPAEWVDKTNVITVAKEKAKSIAAMPLPFSMQHIAQDKPKPAFLTFPTRRGLTNYSAIKEFKNIIQKINKKTPILEKPIGEILKIPVIQKHYKDAVRNNLNGFQLLQTSLSSIKADITLEDKKTAKNIYEKIKPLTLQKRKQFLFNYIEKEKPTANVLKQLSRYIQQKSDIAIQQQALENKTKK